MVGLVMVAYAGLAVLVVVVAWSATRRARGDARFRQGCELLRGAVRAARRRAFVAVGLAALVLAAGAFVGTAVPSMLGLPLAVAPGLAGAAGLLLHAAIAPPQDQGAQGHRRAASLEPRGAGSFVSKRSLTGLAALLSGTLALLVITGATSSPDDAGRYRAISFAGEGFMSSATPYPGWFYAVPLMVTTLLLGIAALLALRRIATTPSLPGTGLERPDRIWREASAKVVVGLALATAGLQAGGTALFAGSALTRAADHPEVALLVQSAGGALFLVGLALLAASLVWLTLAALRAFGLPGTVAHEVATGMAHSGGADAGGAR